MLIFFAKDYKNYIRKEIFLDLIIGVGTP